MRVLIEKDNGRVERSGWFGFEAIDSSLPPSVWEIVRVPKTRDRNSTLSEK